MLMPKPSPALTTGGISAGILLALLLAFSAVTAVAETPFESKDVAAPEMSSSLTGVESALPSAPRPIPGSVQDTTDKNGTAEATGILAKHLTFEAGGGLNFPTKGISPYNRTGFNGTVGAGWMFNSQIGLLGEYQYLQNGLTDYALQQVSQGNCAQNTICASGHASINSFSVSPIFYLVSDSKYNGYFTFGLGLYRKTTTASSGGITNTYSDNKFGYNLGLGLTKQAGWNKHVKYFLETRLLWINTTANYGASLNSVGRTKLAPVTIGLRY